MRNKADETYLITSRNLITIYLSNFYFYETPDIKVKILLYVR